MKSMTGYGKFVVSEQDRQLTVEVKSVNNRYLEINCRIPKALSAVEDTVKRTIKKYLHRGSVDVYFNYENNSPKGKRLIIDGVLCDLRRCAKEMNEKYGLENDFRVSDLLRTPEIVKLEDAAEDDQLLKMLLWKSALTARPPCLTVCVRLKERAWPRI